MCSKAVSAPSSKKESCHIPYKTLAVIAIIGLISLIVYLSITTRFVKQAMDYIETTELGFWGCLIYVLLMVAVSVFFLPQTPVEAAAGLIWSDSYIKALSMAFCAKTIGASVSFLLARKGCKSTNKGGEEHEGSEGKSKYLAAISKIVHKKPSFITLLVCCAYIPAAVKNYGLGSMRPVGFFRHFLLWTMICGLPYSCANVAIGQAAGSVDAIGTKSDPTSIYLIFGFSLVTLFGLAFLARFTKKELDRQIDIGRDSNYAKGSLTIGTGTLSSNDFSGSNKYGTQSPVLTATIV